MTTESKTEKRTESRELVPVAPREVLELGQVLASSGYFQDAKDAGQAVVKILAGQELGFGPISSMTGIYIVKGRVTLSANLIAAAIGRSDRYNYRVGELTDERCEITFVNAAGEVLGVSEFSVEDAKKAGLTHGDNWTKYPRNMLFARALTNGAKWYCPDVMNGELPIQTMEDAGLPEPVAEEVTTEAPEDAGDETPALPERVSAPPEGYEANWTGFWAEMKERFGADLYRAATHDFFGVADENGALKEYAEKRVTEGVSLAQVLGEMRQEVGEGRKPDVLRGFKPGPRVDPTARATLRTDAPLTRDEARALGASVGPEPEQAE